MGKLFKNIQLKNRIDDLANRLHQEGRSSELEAELEKFDINELNNTELKAWYHLYGICAFQRNDHLTAVQRFEKGLVRFKDDDMLRFSLGQEFLYLGEPEKAFKEFDLCQYPSIPSNFVITICNFAYAFNEYQRGMKYMEQFFPRMFQVRELDDQFLYGQGLPFFGTVWASFVGHAFLSGQLAHAEEMLAKCRKMCTSYDFDTLADQLHALKTGDYEPLLSRYRKSASSTTDSQYKDFLNLATAAIEVSHTNTFTDYDSAMQRLNFLNFGQYSPPWFHDVIVVLKACVSNKFSMKEEEQTYIKDFIARQPLLLEPEHALTFGLLTYQETLKLYIQPIKL